MHIPTDKSRAQVKAMAAYGIDGEGICTILALSPYDLTTHYASELATGHIEAVAKVKEALFKAAVGGDVVAMRTWLEQNAGAY